jgi:hypothetical protein
VLIKNTVADIGASGYTPYSQKGGSGGYAGMANGPPSSVGISFATGATLPPELMSVPTTEGQADPLTTTGSFVPGGAQLDAFETPSITLATGEYTSFVAAVCAGSGNTAGQYFALQWQRLGGTALNSYTQTPRIIIGGYSAQMGAR